MQQKKAITPFRWFSILTDTAGELSPYLCKGGGAAPSPRSGEGRGEASILAEESPARRGEGGGVGKGGPLWSPARSPLMHVAPFRFSILAILLLISMLLLAAYGSGSNGSNSSSPSSANVSSATPTQNANHVSLAKLVGTPTAKITAGTNFEVTGQVQNLDKAQHDIYLQATLKNASGQIVGIARGLADNVAAGGMDTYTLQGRLTQPAWSTVVVVITRVSENVNGQGSD